MFVCCCCFVVVVFVLFCFLIEYIYSAQTTATGEYDKLYNNHLIFYIYNDIYFSLAMSTDVTMTVMYLVKDVKRT